MAPQRNWKTGEERIAHYRRDCIVSVTVATVASRSSAGLLITQVALISSSLTRKENIYLETSYQPECLGEAKQETILIYKAECVWVK